VSVVKVSASQPGEPVVLAVSVVADVSLVVEVSDGPEQPMVEAARVKSNRFV
jgi:hypothetical protein